MRAKAKSLRVSPPKKNSTVMGISVVSDVMIDRVSVSCTEVLTISRYVARRMIGTFSRMRSKTMTTSYSE